MAFEHYLDLMIREPLLATCAPNDIPKVLENDLAFSLERCLAHHLQEVVKGGGLAVCIGSQKLLDL